jgi:hypothetical protein
MLYLARFSFDQEQKGAGNAAWRSPKTRHGDHRKRAMAITENAASRSPKTRIAIGGRTNSRELTEV